jgi:hypothetical protein
MIDFILEYGFVTISLDIIPKECELYQKRSNKPGDFEVYQKWSKKLHFSLLMECRFYIYLRCQFSLQPL